ncbi:MAG: uroporphyrinogen-III C-methyltransferase [Chloroflexi bacterium]|nr:uroporphyrinogen-III C-methyltransferase [Chloroflexota bacterium]MDA1228041.1 uroporphyrinogen-III C-methyltransferase [Chloroflexota bacterium]
MTLGIVYLVGAGPGDPGLITVKGLGLIQSAEVIVHDRLVDRRLMQHASPAAEIIDVGKIPGRSDNRQADINALLVDLGKQGKRVVRLKGGDPFVFGRGGEEALELRQEGIPFEIVPGITSSIAAPAYAGIPVTHRGLSSHFTVVTGNEDPDKPESVIEWDKLSQIGGTLVVLMGWENLPSIVDKLLAAGRTPETPVAMVQWGTEPHQKAVTGTLETIVRVAKESKLGSPVVTVIGEVASLRDELVWFDNRPLFGKRILVTRTRTQAGALSDLLVQRGADAVELPTIEVQPLHDYADLDGQLRVLSGFDWVIFASANAVDVMFQRLESMKLDSRAFSNVKLGAIGPATTAVLRRYGLNADFVPESFVSEAVVEGLKHENMAGAKVLLPQGDIARDTLADGLTGLGANVSRALAYRTVTPQQSAGMVEDIFARGVDVATFSSSSTVKNLCELLGDVDRLSNATIACIGPITAATAREMGLNVDIVSERHTIPGMVKAIEEYFSKEE